VLEGNNYPRNLIHNIINKRSKNTPRKEETKPVGTLLLPYIVRLTSVKKSVKSIKINIRTEFSAKNTLKSMLVKLKPKSERQKKSDL
jgi:hypothetical protein